MQVAFEPVDLWLRPAQGKEARANAPVRPSTVRQSGEEPRTAGPHAVNYTRLGDALRGGDAQTARGLSFSGGGDALQEGGADAPGFADMVDIVNPLHHIPLVNMAYQGVTGDRIGGMAQIVGGALFGGPIGAIAGVVGAILTHQTGQSPADRLAGAFQGEPPPARAARAYADFSAPPVKRYNFNRSA